MGMRGRTREREGGVEGWWGERVRNRQEGGGVESEGIGGRRGNRWKVRGTNDCNFRDEGVALLREGGLGRGGSRHCVVLAHKLAATLWR